MKNLIIYTCLLCLFIYMALDYYSFIYLNKQLTCNESFAKSLMYIAMFTSISRLLK